MQDLDQSIRLIAPLFHFETWISPREVIWDLESQALHGQVLHAIPQTLDFRVSMKTAEARFSHR
jgi:hypothetical protein